MTIDLDKMNRAVARAYGDTSDPNYAFVTRALRDGAHDGALNACLGEDFDIVDDTDPNTDVSRVLVLTRGEDVLVVRLSFVGPFATISANTSAPSPAEAVAEIRKTLHGQGFELLDDDELQAEIAFHDDFGTDRRTLYHVLFSADRD